MGRISSAFKVDVLSGPFTSPWTRHGRLNQDHLGLNSLLLAYDVECRFGEVEPVSVCGK